MTDLHKSNLRKDGLRTDPGEGEARDHDLRARFAALRREEEEHIPMFAVPSSAEIRRGHGWTAGRLAGAGACAIAIVAAVSLLGHITHHPTEEGPSAVSITAWRAPTDFLLKTPGSELLQTVPAIGEWHDYAVVPEGVSGRRGKQGRKRKRESE
jgi:hypothetical protein